MNDNKDPVTNTNHSKKVYQQPELQIYGDLREITQLTGTGLKMDGGGMMGMNKTNG